MPSGKDRALAVRLCIAMLFILAATGAAAERTCSAYPHMDDPASALVARLAPAFELFPGLETALRDGIAALCFDDAMVGAHGYYEPESGSITIAAALGPGAAEMVLVHELRHVQQTALGACPAPGLSMAEHARAVLAMEADASVTTLVVASALADAGNGEMRRAFLDWPMQADLVAAFDAAREATGDLAAAAARAFDAWYAGDARREAYYRAACSDYLDRQDRLHILGEDGTLPPDFFESLCRLPDGRAYPCDSP